MAGTSLLKECWQILIWLNKMCFFVSIKMQVCVEKPTLEFSKPTDQEVTDSDERTRNMLQNQLRTIYFYDRGPGRLNVTRRTPSTLLLIPIRSNSSRIRWKRAGTLASFSN